MRERPDWTIGRHTFRWDAPDVLWVRFEGNNTLEEAIEMVRLYKDLGERQPYFILANSEAAGQLHLEARRHLSEHMRPEWFHGIIFYNTRLLHRAMARGLILAAELFHARPPQASVMHERLHFVATQAHARALVDALRPQGPAARAC
mgnify:CR=1 FL=1